MYAYRHTANDVCKVYSLKCAEK